VAPQAQALAFALLFVVSVGLLYRFFAWLGSGSRAREANPPVPAKADVSAQNPSEPQQAAAAQALARAVATAAPPAKASATLLDAPLRAAITPSIAATLAPQGSEKTALKASAKATLAPPAPLRAPSVAATLPPSPPSAPAPIIPASPAKQNVAPDPAPTDTQDTAPKKSVKAPRSTTTVRPKIAGASGRAASRRPVREEKETSAARPPARIAPTLPVLRARADQSRLKVVGPRTHPGRYARDNNLKQRLADRFIRIVGAEHARRIDAGKRMSASQQAA